MLSTLRYVGLDVHKVNTVVAVAEGSGGEASVWGRVASDYATVERELKKLGGPACVRVVGFGRASRAGKRWRRPGAVAYQRRRRRWK